MQSFQLKLKKVSFKKNIFYFFVCIIPISIGFIIPVLILISLSFDNFNISSFIQVLEISFNSLSISLIGALLIILISFLIAVSVRYHASKKLSYFSIAAGSGYAFPGVILALGTTVVLSMFQEVLNSLFFTLKIDWNIALIGSYSALLFAYICRFNAIGFGSINSGILRMPPNLLEASRMQGASFQKGLFSIVTPLIRPSILTGLLLIFVDIFKELPMTLLLIPFNFETLATYVYQYAKEEMLEQCALGALFIVLIGIIPIIVLNKAINLSSQR
jgi:iron(III) transport system permease protein